MKNKRQNNHGQVLALLIVSAAMVFAVLSSCNNEIDKPKTCECDPGTEHLSGDLGDGKTECCDLCADDHCTIVDGKTMANGIKVYITDGVTGVTADQAIAKINAAFAEMVEWGAPIEDINFAKNNIDIVRIVPAGKGLAEVKKENGQWVAIIEANAILDTITDAFCDFAVKNMTALFKQFDNSKNNVRMALG